MKRIDPKGITVAIVTGRRNEDCRYEEWRSLRNAFLSGRPEWVREGVPPLDLGAPQRRHPYLGGEFGAVMTTVFAGEPPPHHTGYQVRALALQTRLPDEVLIVSRGHDPNEDWDLDGWPFPVRRLEPLISPRELELHPELCGMHLSTAPRSTKDSFGCSDKNTALVACRTENMIMLDDCCLAGPGLVEAALAACTDRKVLFIRHRQLRLPTAESPVLAVADANDNLEQAHTVLGIWAAPISVFLAINGWNTDLDEQRGGLDAELKQRLDNYARMADIEYVVDPVARVYEIEHDYPWGMTRNDDPAPAVGYGAPGPSLRKIRDAIQPWLDLDDDNGDEEEIDEEEEDGGPFDE